VSGHIVHRLERGTAWWHPDPFAPADAPRTLVEVIGCGECGLKVRRPDEMPDYSQVDRMWRTR
jgi:hypothetical protein